MCNTEGELVKERQGERRGLRMFTAAVAIVAVLGLAACSGDAEAISDAPHQTDAALPGPMVEQLDAALAQAIALSAASGGIAGVWAPWSGEWTNAQGTTTRGGKAPISTDMHFRSAAVGRPMLCTVMLKMADAGELKVTDAISAHLRDFPGVDGITLGQLCQGTSGLSDYTPQFRTQFVNNPRREWSNMELAAGGLALGSSEPGTGWQDSATSTVILGMVLSAISGLRLPDLYEKYIFEPLGFDETIYPDASMHSLKHPSPHGYAAALGADGSNDCTVIRDETTLSPTAGGVGGGIVSTIGEMRLWTQALAAGTLLSDKSTEAQVSTIGQGGDTPAWQSYGLGVQKIGPLIGHDGEIPGFLTASYTDPASGFTVAVMLNNSTAGKGFARQLAMQLASIAAMAPAAEGETAPTMELPWSAEQAVAALQAGAVCQEPAPEAAPAG